MSWLTIENLTTCYFTKAGPVKAVDGVAFSLDRGQALGIAGESGCGKSTIALSLMRLIKGGAVVDGRVLLNGVSLLDLPEKDFNAIRWDKIALVSQAAMGAWNPVLTIGAQIVEGILAHRTIKKSEAFSQARELLRKVEIDPDRINNYPHELSGGMRQRAMLAMALALNPEVLIADEPTTALDVVTQAQMIKLLKKLQEELNLAVIFISHDLSILAQVCDNVLIMYAGKAMEFAEVHELYARPRHPYARALLDSFPDIAGERKVLRGLPGTIPDVFQPPSGCTFHPRCVYARELCQAKEPALSEIQPRRFVACHYPL